MIGESSSGDELVVEEEPAAPKAEPGTRPVSRPAISPAPPTFPPYEHVIDGDEQQWVYYYTRTDGEVVRTIASTFEADTDEVKKLALAAPHPSRSQTSHQVIESNGSRYSKLKPKSKLKEGTLLIIGACDSLLVCSGCRRDEREGDPIIICRENW